MAEQQAENPEVTDDGFAEDSLSADIAAAMDADEANVETGEIVAETAEIPAETGDEPAETAETAEIDEPGAETPAETVETVAEDTPPSSLPPEAREAWKETPEPMRKAIAKREQDYEKGILKYANSAKRAEMMDSVLQPFQQYFATNGNNPPQTLSNLLQTASTLQMGAPMQKAQTVAQLINDFGVDIATLDSVLSGSPLEQQQQGLDPQIQQQLAPIQQFIAQQQAAQQQAAQQQVADVRGQVAQFAQDPANEFYKDVALDMAQILELDANRPGGEPVTMKQAYDRACMMHPQISQILQARKNAPTEDQRAAASSLGGSPGGPGMGNAAPDSIRGALEEIWPSGGRI